MRIIFWNVNRKPLPDLVAAMASANDAEVIVLAECTDADHSTTLRVLKEKVDGKFFTPECISTRFHCFCKDPALDLAELHSGSRISVRRLILGSTSMLLVIIHGVDIRNYDSETRQSYAQLLADDIRFAKSTHGIDRVILLGDFNMNPYDRGMNLAAGLNAMMTRSCVENGHRTFAGKTYDFYYNPMWSLFGDGTDGPAGTFYDTSNQGPYGWSMLDQVVVDSSTVKYFQSVRILTHAENFPLIDAKGHPDSKNASDHLPILVQLNNKYIL